MKVILLSGGSGKRLWPLTSSKRAKQYLSMLEGPSGISESLLERAWRQLSSVGLAQHTHVSTSLAQLEVVKRQTNEKASVVLEPESRDTYPAVALAAAYLYSIAGVSLDETIVVVPVDAYVEDDFYNSLLELPAMLHSSGTELVTLQITVDDEPSRSEERSESILAEDTTRKQLKSASESGVYGFRLGYLITKLIRQGLPSSYEELYRQYGRLPRTSMKAELERMSPAHASIRYPGKWRNLNTWKAISENISFHKFGRKDGDCEGRNIKIINELHIPITIVGLDNLLVAASPDGILIASQAAGTQLDARLRALSERPGYEEYNWGHSRIIDRTTLLSGKKAVTKRIKVTAGCNMHYDMHFHRSEVWTVLSGEGVAMLDERSFRINAGDTVRISERSRHSVLAITDMEILEVQTGDSVHDDDCIRLGSTWEEITGQIHMA